MLIGSSGIEEKIVILEVLITREIALSIPDFPPKLPKIDLGSPLETYLSKDNQESNWQEESKVLPYKPAEPL